MFGHPTNFVDIQQFFGFLTIFVGLPKTISFKLFEGSRSVRFWTCLFRGTTTAAAEDDGTPEDSSRCLSRCCEGGAIVCPRPLSSPALTQRERERERERANGENAGPQLETASLSLSVPEEEEKKKASLLSRPKSRARRRQSRRHSRLLLLLLLSKRL